MEQIVFWLTGFLGVPLVNALKPVFAAEGKSAMWLTAAVAGVLAVVAVFASEAANWTQFSPEALFAAFGQVLAAATLAYKLLANGGDAL
jgi:uncharacterized membrane protein